MDSDTVPPPPDAPPGSPFRSEPEPEQPRLGILHLLVWTACVAVYFSIMTAFRSDDYVPSLDPLLLLSVAMGIGQATALAGLLLLAARRYRRLPFPGQPGETLLVLLGVGAAIGLGRRLVICAALALGELGTTTHLLVQVLQNSAMVVLGVLYLIAALRTKTLRWRVYFATVSLGGAIVVLLMLFLVRELGARRIAAVVYQGALLLALAVLLVVAVKDRSRRLHYRWTHWLGVGVGLWIGAINAVSFASHLLSPS